MLIAIEAGHLHHLDAEEGLNTEWVEGAVIKCLPDF